jgi:CheY-like chemotaxis protein
MNRKRLLIIDDDTGLTQMVKLNLEATGNYEVCIENCSTQAAATARTFRPDLILLDYIMPGMDGGDVSSALRGDPFLRNIPIVMVTALVSNQEMREDGTVRCGGQLMLAKPVKIGNLIKCIERELMAAA